jgi:Tfp pilus assembly protein PilE
MFTVLFTIVVFNVLIAILGQEWEKLVERNAIDDAIAKLDMILEIVNMRAFTRRAFHCGIPESKAQRINEKSDMYFVFRKKKIDQGDEAFRQQFSDHTSTLKSEVQALLGKCEQIHRHSEEKNQLI